MKTQTAILWFHKDLRLQDQPALAAAEADAHPIIPLFIWAPHEEDPWRPGGASQWWLHHALQDLDKQLRGRGSRLLLRKAASPESSLEILERLIEKCGATSIYWNRRHEPSLRRRDEQIEAKLRGRGYSIHLTEGKALLPPKEIANRSGKPFKIFTPMWRHYQKLEIPRPAATRLTRFQLAKDLPRGDTLTSLGLLPDPKIGWDSGLEACWGIPSRSHLDERLQTFLKSHAADYPDQRDLPALDGTSRLSPYLHHGQIGPHELWWTLTDASKTARANHEAILRQLVWREFAIHLLAHFPSTPQEPLRPEYAVFPREPCPKFLRAWQRGETGYPIVDAGLRQLWQTGWMHNRVRMIVGSFLVKHLLQPWEEGAHWFWDTLVDADLANNTLGWQWIAGCGADAAPCFRIFNPITQGERFDAKGDYIRRYLPELARLPTKFIHQPWELSELELSGGGVVLGKQYPAPIIPHSEGRQRALDAYQVMRERRDRDQAE